MPSPNPWPVLGLDPACATERDIKTAYARLLKTSRPEVDPEGFQRVRQAYEEACRQLTNRAKEPPAPTSESTEAPLSSPVATAGAAAQVPALCPAPSESPALREACANLSAAVTTRVRSKIREALAALDRITTEEGLNLKDRAALFFKTFGGQTSLLAELCTMDRLFSHLNGQDASLPSLVVTHWRASEQTARLTEFAELLVKRDAVAKTESGALICSQVAIALGVSHPKLAEDLMRLAYGHLSPEHRRDLSQMADAEIQLGRILLPIPGSDRGFWLSLLRGTRTVSQWRDNTSRQLLSTLLRTCGPNWPGFAFLKIRMAAHDWATLVEAIRTGFRFG